MVYSLSSNIQIFPVTKRNIWDPLGRLTTEYNLTSILNKLLDEEGFVITPNKISGNIKSPIVTSIDDDSSLDFNLNGYIIHLKKLWSLITSLPETSSLSDGTSIYACIELGTPTSASQDDDYKKKHLKYLKGEDISESNSTVSTAATGDTYQGVTFTSTKPTETEDKVSLKILEYHIEDNIEYSDNGWYIPKESQIKFKSTLERTSISIDDGEI